MKVLGIIPARLGSTRLARKMLININGKPLVYYTYRQALKAKSLDGLVIATDSQEIVDAVSQFDAPVIMTSESIQSGSDRVAVASKKFKDFIPDIVVNIQGDEPLMPARAIDQTVKALQEDKTAVVATPATVFEQSHDVHEPGFVKVVVDRDNNALYFSRSQIPYPRGEFKTYFKHLGLYAYRREFLYKYTKMKQTPLELAEKLEQLRILENGYKIKVVQGNFKTLEVNTPHELSLVRKLIK